METIVIDNDILVAYAQASSFPDGVMAAHMRIHNSFPDTGEGRIFYGLSRPENGGAISYKAATAIKSATEAEQKGLGTIELKKGNYLGILVSDFMKNTTAIGNAFQQILKQRGIDPDGYCVEVYLNEKDVQCMVRMTG